MRAAFASCSEAHKKMNLDLIWEGAQHVCRMQIPKNETKTTPHVRVRWLMMHVARKRGYSLVTIAQFFGMHHTSVMHALNKFEKLGAVRELPELERYLDKPPVVIRPQRLEKPLLEKLPVDREGITHHFSITHKEGDEVKIFDAYLTVNLYEDGRVGEFFITAGRDSNAHAMFDIWAISTSRLFQRGEPLEFLQKFVGVRQEIAGITSNPEIRSCSSVVDYVARYLLKRFGGLEMQS